MKRFIAILSIISIILSLSACNIDGQIDFDIAFTRELNLGKEVDSVLLTTAGGETITCDGTADFYEIFNKIDFNFRTSKNYSCIAETKLADQSKSLVNMNVYNVDSAVFYEFRAMKEGDAAIALIEEYTYQSNVDNKFKMDTFCRYLYKNAKAFGGSESGENGTVMHSSDTYPIIPVEGTELIEMQARATLIRNVINLTAFFASYQPIEANGKTYDLDQFITREYKLYENYIVFKQTSSFLNLEMGMGADLAITYAKLLNSEPSITQEAYCNVKTGEIELIKVYGSTAWHMPEYWNKNLEIDLTIYINNGASDGNQKIEALINYVKTNAD
jgi:hypothetical protein